MEYRIKDNPGSFSVLWFVYLQVGNCRKKREKICIFLPIRIEYVAMD